ncbi:MAG: cytochrome c [Bacteroidetes bacterium]|nr:cytochrome c [Bacteroidota bacterium]MCW5896740.1 cytochrome c [Bacteroidota bacterium]
MVIKIVNTVLLLLFIMLIATIFLVRRDYTTRNIEILPGMVAHTSYPSLAATSVFPDGKLLQPPVEGTIARGFPPISFSASEAEAKRAGEELQSPLVAADTLHDIQRGGKVYAAVCSPCHGAGGAGDGTVAQRGFPPPPSLFAENAMKMKNGQMFHVITFGQKNMPSLAAQVTRADRWHVIAYIRSLQTQQRSLAAGQP